VDVRKDTAAIGWVGLILYVVLYDYFSHKTLSQAFWDAKKEPLKCILLVITWSYLTAHLFELMPERFDALYHVAKLRRHYDTHDVG